MQKFIKMIYIILEDEITEKTKEAFILLNISLSQVCSPVLLTKTKTKTIKQCFIEIKLKKIDEMKKLKFKTLEQKCKILPWQPN